MKTSKTLGEFIEELTMAMITGFKSKHDDAIDTISMLAYIKAWKPSNEVKTYPDPESNLWELDDGFDDEDDALAGYLG